MTRRVLVMRLERILQRVYFTPWAILPSTHASIQRLLESHLAGNPLPTYQTDADDGGGAYTIIGNTAVVDVEGVLLNKCSGLETLCGAFSLEDFRSNLRALDRNENVENIILNISSGGGIITGVPETADLIADIATRKDVYAYSNDVIGSAAYWIASQSTAILLSKSAQAGSIGVYLALVDVTRQMAIAGEKLELFKAGTYKALGLDGNPLSDDDRKLLQEGVDKAYAQFTGYVTSTRKGVKPETMQGQMFDAADCINNGLADGILDNLDDLITYLNSK